MKLERPFFADSVAYKGLAIAFGGLYLPLFTIAMAVAALPERFSALDVLLMTLAAMLVAGVAVVMAFTRLFRPLREAADDLMGFMTRGEPMRLPTGSQDEIGRLIRMLRHAMAHLDRSRAPLLRSGARSLDRKTQVASSVWGTELRVMALLEIDQWQVLDEAGRLDDMQEALVAASERVVGELQEMEQALPWGRGRFLLLLKSTPARSHERMEALCAPFQARGISYTCSAAIEARTHGELGWSSALQRLEQKLFAMRLRDEPAAVA